MPHDVLLFRGSCAGFVEQCFDDADFDIVYEEGDTLPGWPLDELLEIAPHMLGTDYDGISEDELV
jgi:hypothetical protein